MKKIVVPLDGTVLAEQALPTAVSFARRTGAQLVLVIASGTFSGDGLERWPWAIVTPTTRGDYVAHQALALAESTGLVVAHAVLEGDDAQAICQYADEAQADLIIMASRGHTGLARVLGGSVADAVVRHARQPVLVLRSAASARRIHGRAVRLERVLVALDDSDESRAALAAALALADPGVTELHLVRVMKSHERAGHPGPRRDRTDRDATARALDDVNAWIEQLADTLAERTTCDVYPHVHVDDDIAHGILHVARGFNVSMIAMGTRGRGASRLFVGSIAEQVLENGRYPVLLVSGAHAKHESPSHRRKEA
jgi:nucleotide-binding universal stress UspA family protein